MKENQRQIPVCYIWEMLRNLVWLKHGMNRITENHTRIIQKFMENRIKKINIFWCNNFLNPCKYIMVTSLDLFYRY